MLIEEGKKAAVEGRLAAALRKYETAMVTLPEVRRFFIDVLPRVMPLYSAQVGMVVSRTGSVFGKAPKRQLHRTAIAVSGNAYTGN